MKLKHEPWCPVRNIKNKEELKQYIVVFRNYIVTDDGKFIPQDAFVKCIVCDSVLAEKRFEEG